MVILVRPTHEAAADVAKQENLMSHFLPGSCALRPAHRYRCVSLPMHPSSRPGPGRGLRPVLSHACARPARWTRPRSQQRRQEGSWLSLRQRGEAGGAEDSDLRYPMPRFARPRRAFRAAPRRRALDHARTTHGSGLRLAASGCSVRIPPDRVRRARRMGGASRAATGDPRHLVCGGEDRAAGCRRAAGGRAPVAGSLRRHRQRRGRLAGRVA